MLCSTSLESPAGGRCLCLGAVDSIREAHCTSHQFRGPRFTGSQNDMGIRCDIGFSANRLPQFWWFINGLSFIIIYKQLFPIKLADKDHTIDQSGENRYESETGRWDADLVCGVRFKRAKFEVDQSDWQRMQSDRLGPRE